MNYYCTHFDINYISHSLSLYHSICCVDNSFRIFMFCMDEASIDHVRSLELEHVTLISYLDLETFLPDLANAKSNRSRVEYFYTCSPAICFYVLQKFPEVSLITYLDADLYFFSNPQPLFEELGYASIGIIEHRFHWLTKRNKKYGNFNVGWITFRKDTDGMKCLRDWLKDCIDWCYQRLENGKYADQKYLDSWPKKYDNVKILHNKGANVAVWNIGNYHITYLSNKVKIDDVDLIFYHFANLRQVGDDLFTTDLSRVLKRTSNVIADQIYQPYIQSLKKFQCASIVAKKDIQTGKLAFKFKEFSRIIRQMIYPDFIKVKSNENELT